MNSVSTVVLLVCALILAGCNPFDAPDAMMDEYVERVARVLGQEPELSRLPSAERFPRPRIRRLEMPSIELGMLDFLSLYGCELQQVVGEKTSILGRVMQPLNRLRYELRFIEAAKDCLPEIENEELSAALQKAIASKTKSLPIAVWNATWAVEEAESLLTLTKGRLPINATGNITAELAADLARLNKTVAAIRAGDLEQDLDYVGQIHQRWLAEHRAGQLINSARLLTARLSDATALIHERLNSQPLCIAGKPSAQARVVEKMFFSIFIERVQPYLAAVRRARDDLIAPLAELARLQQGVMPADFKPYYRNNLAISGEGSLWQRLEQTSQRHVEAWQTLLAQCGLRPSA